MSGCMGTSMSRESIFKDAGKLAAQAALKNAIVRAIQNTEGTELDDIIYVLMEQVVFWQLTYFEHLNRQRGDI